MRELTQIQKNDLLEQFDADLSTLVNSATTEGLKRTVGFVSLCKRLDVPTDAYRNSRSSDEDFRTACEALEDDLRDILAEMVYGNTMKDGKPKDQLALAERVQSDTFGKKAEQHVHHIALHFQQLPPEQLDSELRRLDDAVLHVLEDGNKYKSNNVRDLLNE